MSCITGVMIWVALVAGNDIPSRKAVTTMPASELRPLVIRLIDRIESLEQRVRLLQRALAAKGRDAPAGGPLKSDFQLGDIGTINGTVLRIIDEDVIISAHLPRTPGDKPSGTSRKPSRVGGVQMSSRYAATGVGPPSYDDYTILVEGMDTLGLVSYRNVGPIRVEITGTAEYGGSTIYVAEVTDK